MDVPRSGSIILKSIGGSKGRAAEKIVGRERRERLSQLAWRGAGCFDSRRRVNSTVRAHRSVRTASGSDPIKAQLEWMIPSLPLRVLTRGPRGDSFRKGGLALLQFSNRERRACS